jgi:hypothetical protein
MDIRSDPAGDRRARPRDRGGPPAIPRPLVRCGTCERVEYLSAADLAGYVQGGWPRCCGGVMVYALEGDPPAGAACPDHGRPAGSV